MEHLTPKQIELFGRRALPGNEHISFGEHLFNCSSCNAEFVSSLKRHERSSLTINLSRDFWLADSHISYDQLVRFTDGKLDADEDEVIELHLEACSACQEGVNEFVSFRRQIAPEMEVSYSPIPIDSAVTKTTAWNPFRVFAWTPTYAIAILLIALLVVLGSLFIRSRRSNFQANRDNVPQTTEKEPSDNRATNDAPAPPVSKESPSEKQDISSLIVLNDGDRTISIDSGGNLSGLDEIPQSSRNEIAQAFLRERIEPPSVLRTLKGNDRSLRGSDTQSSFKLLSPTRIVVESNQPTFRWVRVPNASSYRVYLYASEGNETKSDALSPEVTEWTSKSVLKRGEFYTWSVVAVVDGNEILAPGPSSPEMKFHVLSSNSVKQLNQLRATRSHLALGVFYAKQGMVNEAKRELEIVSRSNPESTSAKRLLQQIQSW